MAGKVTETAVVGGVDTHKDLHVAAVVKFWGPSFSPQHGKVTGRCWHGMISFGALKRIGVECTGTYGSGLLRYLQNAGLEVLEVTAPDRMERRKRGKSNTIDAECAAHAAFSGIRTVTPKTRNGMIESLRVLKTCRKTAISARRVALQIIHSNIISASDELREQLRNMTRMQLIRTLGSWRPDASEYRNVTNVYRISLKSLARRYLELHDEIADLDVMIAAIVDELAPELIKRNAIGYESASQLLITAGNNPQRLRSEPGFAALCGVSPVPVSSGKTNRYRLNQGGDRAANSALHIIAIGRLRTDDKTKEYVARRVVEGHTKMEAIRCLKRYISREVYTLLRNQNRLLPPPDNGLTLRRASVKVWHCLLQGKRPLHHYNPYKKPKAVPNKITNLNLSREN